MARRGDTVGIPASDNESVSVSVRKIDNGYVVCRSRFDGANYTSSESFSAEKPRLDVEGQSQDTNTGPESMKRAVAALNSRK